MDMKGTIEKLRKINRECSDVNYKLGRDIECLETKLKDSQQDTKSMKINYDRYCEQSFTLFEKMFTEINVYREQLKLVPVEKKKFNMLRGRPEDNFPYIRQEERKQEEY